VVVQVETPSVETRRTDSHEDEAAQKLARYTFWLMVFTAGLVVVGILQAVALILQALLLGKHSAHLHSLAGAATDNAKAASFSAKATVISERPWFVVEIKAHSSDSTLHIVRAVNRGRTPAELYEVHCTWGLQPMAGFEPPKNFTAPIIHPMQSLFFTGDDFQVLGINAEARLTAENSTGVDPRTVYVYGRILYWDKFTDRQQPGVEPYLTQWCFHYIPVKTEFSRTANGYTMHT
jgi:hypothetical protein